MINAYGIRRGSHGQFQDIILALVERMRKTTKRKYIRQES
jgi:hypothetical protein